MRTAPSFQGCGLWRSGCRKTAGYGSEVVAPEDAAAQPTYTLPCPQLIANPSPKFEFYLGEEERGVSVSHELYPDVDGELARRIVVDGPRVDIESTVRTYGLDLSRVDPDEAADARTVLGRMHRYGGFTLESR